MPTRADPEEALAALAEGGLRGDSRRAWELFDEAWPSLVAWMGRLLRVARVPTELAEDAGQAALLRVWRGRMDYRGSSSAELLGWIRVILRREVARSASDGKRHAAPGEPLPEPSAGDTTAQVVEASDEQRALADCLAELPAAEREVVELLYSSSSPTEREAAVILERSKTRVNALRGKALGLLADCLRAKGLES